MWWQHKQTFNAPLDTPQQYSAGQLVNQLLVFHQYSKVYQQWTQWQEKEERKMSSNIDTKCPHSPSLTRWTGWDLPPPALSAWAALSVYIAHIPNGTVKKKKKRTLLESGLLTRAPTCSSMASCLGRREKDRPRRSFTPLRHPGNRYFLLAILSRSGVYYWRRRD